MVIDSKRDKEPEVAALEVQDILLSFGKLRVLSGISFKVFRDDFFSIVGPNGAGKTSILNCISGVYRPEKGRIVFMGDDVSDISVHKRVRHGIVRTFQGVNLFASMSVLDNIMTGRNIWMTNNPLKAAAYWPFTRNEEVKEREIVEEIIDFLEIQEYRHATVGLLPYGIQKRVDLARALALKPKILLLDEPMAGMNLEEKQDMARFLLDIHQEKRIPLILIEHDMEVVVDITSRCLVIDWGTIICEGSPDEIIRDPKVVEAYIGEEGNDAV